MLVCCDGCVRAYHRSCVLPPLRVVPETWFCPVCAPIADLETLQRILAARPRPQVHGLLAITGASRLQHPPRLCNVALQTNVFSCRSWHGIIMHTSCTLPLKLVLGMTCMLHSVLIPVPSARRQKAR